MEAGLRRVAFIRHGETPVHVGANRFCGDLDPALTERGRQQAESARARLLRVMPLVDAAWTSPRLRARSTAQMVLPQASWLVLDDLRELSFGQWEGLTKEEARSLTPEAYRSWEEDAYRHGPPGGESGLEAQPRIERLIQTINASPAENILLVSHITLLRLMISQLIAIPLSEARKSLDVQQGGVGLLEVKGPRGKLTALNLGMEKE